MADNPTGYPASWDEAIDLTALAEKIRRDKAYKKLYFAIQNLHAAMSVRAELQRAAAKMALFFELMPIDDFTHERHVEQDSRAASIAGSIFQDALLTYVRATHTMSEHRRKTPISDRLPEDLKPAHKRVTEVRDDAIAHHGKAANAVRRPWNIESTVLHSPFDETRHVRFHNESTNYMASTVNDLAQLLSATQDLSEQLAAQREHEFFRELEQFKSDAILMSAFLTTHFDSSTVYSFPAFRRDFSAASGSTLPTSSQADEEEYERFMEVAKNWPSLAKRLRTLMGENEM